MKRNVQREFRFDAPESETLCMDKSSHRGNRETSEVPCGDHLPMERSEKATSRTADMYVTEESDGTNQRGQDSLICGSRVVSLSKSKGSGLVEFRNAGC